MYIYYTHTRRLCWGAFSITPCSCAYAPTPPSRPRSSATLRPPCRRSAHTHTHAHTRTHTHTHTHTHTRARVRGVSLSILLFTRARAWCVALNPSIRQPINVPIYLSFFLSLYCFFVLPLSLSPLSLSSLSLLPPSPYSRRMLPCILIFVHKYTVINTQVYL